MADVNDDQMSPDASPGSKGKGVRRVNNLPLILAIGGLVLFAVIIAFVAAGKGSGGSGSASDDADAGGSSGGTDTTTMANSIIGDNGSDGVVPENTPNPPSMPEDDNQVPQKNTPAQQVINNPPQLQQQRAPEPDPQAEQMRQAKMQAFEKAVNAKTAVSMEDYSRSKGSSSVDSSTPRSREEMQQRIQQVQDQMANSGDTGGGYKEALAQAQSAAGGSGGAGGGGGMGGDDGPQLLQDSDDDSGQGNSRNDINQFDNKGNGDRWALNSKMDAPKTPYELRAGAVIPGVMISGINSDLPGQINGQVSQDVYDTATGSHLLIPQGTRLVGSYSSNVAYGQSAVMIAWQRLVFPDGKALDIGAMPGADSAGYSGFRDKVNNHYWRVFGSAFLLSGVTAGTSYATDRNSNSGFNSTPSMSDELSQALGQQLGQTTAQVVSKNLNISPTLEIRPGYRFNIIVTKDMAFTKPYQSFDYQN